ncbi:hypothetical protein XENOCAPTIV_021260, partial [Xenoophorus captivus]
LNAGALYILWLQIGHGPGGVQIHRAVHSAMQGLLATSVNHRSAVIMSVSTAGCSSGLSSEAKGVYVLFFLLSSLILTLLAVAGTLYHRHHRGGFVVRCPSSLSPPDSNNNHLHPDDSYSTPTDCDLPPPPPPASGSRESWTQMKERCPPVDLPLLRFSSLLPPDGYIDPQESGKM